MISVSSTVTVPSQSRSTLKSSCSPSVRETHNPKFPKFNAVYERRFPGLKAARTTVRGV
jgi:hypothetical protein